MERKGDVLIVDGSGADSCNDLICLCAWRWKDRTPPERIAPSFSVNRVNYLYNEICKVVNFSSSLFLPSQLFTLSNTFWVQLFPPLNFPHTHGPPQHPPIAFKTKTVSPFFLLVPSINIISFALCFIFLLFIHLHSQLLIHSPFSPLHSPPSTLHVWFCLISLLEEVY